MFRLPLNRLKNSYLVSNGSYLGLFQILTILIGLTSQYLFTNFWYKHQYGKYLFVMNILGLLAFFALPGISTSIISAVARKNDGNFLKGTKWKFLSAIGGSIALLGFSLFYFCKNEITFSKMFLFAACLFPLYWMDSYLAYWNGKQKFNILFWFKFSRRILLFLAVAILITRNCSILQLFIVIVGLTCLFNLVGVLSILVRKDLNRNFEKKSFQYGKHLTLMQLFGLITAHLDKLIIGIFFGYSALAIFVVGQIIYTYLKQGWGIIQSLYIPKLAEKDRITAVEIMKRHLKYVCIGYGAVALVLFAALPSVFSTLFPRYMESVRYAYFFIIAYLLVVPELMYQAYFRAQNMIRETYLIGLSRCIIFIPLLFILCYLFGIFGIIAATGAANLFQSFFGMALIRKVARIETKIVPALQEQKL